MKTRLLIHIIFPVALVVMSCNNNENTPAKAGTSDSAGIGHEKGKGTPYRGDSAAKGLQSDSARQR